MITGLQEINAVFSDEIDDAVFLRQTPRPCVWGKVLQRLWLAQTVKRVSQDGFNKR